MWNDNWILWFHDLEKFNPFENFDIKNSYKIFNTSNLKKLWDTAKQVLRWCDYLRGISKSRSIYELPIFRILNSTNSSDANIVWYSPYYYENWEKIYLPFWYISFTVSNFSSCNKYTFSVSYAWKSYEVLEIYINFDGCAKYNQNNIWCMIDFKWKPFRLEAMTSWIFKPFDFLIGILLTWFNDNWELEFNCLNWRNEFRVAEILSEFHITRYDLRFDFFLPKWHLGLTDNQVLFKNKSKYSDYFQKLNNYSKKLNNCPYWCKDRHWMIYTGRTAGDRKNKYSMIRFYQKQVDVWCKWQGDLYSEYLNFEGEVRRLEIEFGSKFCNQKTKQNIDGDTFTFYEEFEEKKLTDKALQYVWIKEKTCNFTPKYKAPELNIDKYTFKALKTKYIIMQNSIKFFCNNWFYRYDLIDSCLTKYEKIDNEKFNKWDTKLKIEKMLE